MPRSRYSPPSDAADILSRHKEAVDTQRQLREPLRQIAAREMRAGVATIGDLAKLSGLSAEYFRRIAREEAIELRRPPTVGGSRSDDQSPAERPPAGD